MKNYTFMLLAFFGMIVGCSENPEPADPSKTETCPPREDPYFDYDYMLMNQSDCTIAIVNDPRCLEFPDSLVLLRNTAYRFRAEFGAAVVEPFFPSITSASKEVTIYYLNEINGSYKIGHRMLKETRNFCYPERYTAKEECKVNLYTFRDDDYSYAAKYGVQIDDGSTLRKSRKLIP